MMEVSNEVLLIRPCASEIPPKELVREHSVLGCKMYRHAVVVCTLLLTCLEARK